MTIIFRSKFNVPAGGKINAASPCLGNLTLKRRSRSQSNMEFNHIRHLKTPQARTFKSDSLLRAHTYPRSVHIPIVSRCHDRGTCTAQVMEKKVSNTLEADDGYSSFDGQEDATKGSATDTQVNYTPEQSTQAGIPSSTFFNSRLHAWPSVLASSCSDSTHVFALHETAIIERPRLVFTTVSRVTQSQPKSEAGRQVRSRRRNTSLYTLVPTLRCLQYNPEVSLLECHD